MCLALLHACWGQVTGKAAIQASAKSSVKIVRKLNFTAHKEASAQWGAGVHEMISHILDNEVRARLPLRECDREKLLSAKGQRCMLSMGRAGARKISSAHAPCR